MEFPEFSIFIYLFNFKLTDNSTINFYITIEFFFSRGKQGQVRNSLNDLRLEKKNNLENGSRGQNLIT